MLTANVDIQRYGRCRHHPVFADDLVFWNSLAGFYSAGVGSGGGLAAGGVVVDVLAAAAFFSTMRTAQIEPSYSASKGIASEAWLNTSGGVRTAAMMNAMTMK